MLNYIIAGIVAILIYQIITLVIYLVSGEKDDLLVIVATLVPYGISALFVLLIRAITLAYYRRNYNCYLFCQTEKNKDNNESPIVFYAYAKPSDVIEFSQDKNDEYYIELYLHGKDFKSIPWKTDIYKGQDTFRSRKMSLFKKH